MNILYSQKLSQFAIHHGFTTKLYSNSDHIIFPKQNHTNNVVNNSNLDSYYADGIVTTYSKKRIGVKTADCLPILFYEPEKHLVAAVHAGWKGTTNKIAEKAVDKIVEYGGKSQNLYVAFGPSIEFDCYDIPDERIPNIKETLGEDREFLKKKAGKYFFNLAYANYKQLVDVGVPENNIEISEWCTFCNDWLFSRRRDKGKEKGQNISFIEMN